MHCLVWESCKYAYNDNKIYSASLTYGSACIFCILRTIFLSNIYDGAMDRLYESFWYVILSALEDMFLAVGGSIPMLRPLWILLFGPKPDSATAASGIRIEQDFQLWEGDTTTACESSSRTETSDTKGSGKWPMKVTNIQNRVLSVQSLVARRKSEG